MTNGWLPWTEEINNVAWRSGDDGKWYSVMHLQCMPGAGGFSGVHPVGFVLCLVHGYVEAALDEQPAY